MPRCRNRPIATWLAAFAASLAAVMTVFGQTQAPTPQFREGVDLGHVDVTVLDGKRQTVRGLTAANFTLQLDGKPQPIRAFAAVDVPSPPPALMTVAPWTSEIAPDVQANTASDEGRLVVIFFDRSIPPGPKLEVAKRIARAAVRELGPNDMAAVTSVRSHAYQGFTADRARLLRTIDRATPGSAESDDEKVVNARVFASEPEALAYFRANEACTCNTCVLHQIQQIADTLHDVPRPKLLLFIGSQLTLSTQDANPLGNVVAMGPTAIAQCSAPLRDARASLLQALDRAHVVIHTLDPSGLEIGPGLDAGSSFRSYEVQRQVQENQKLSVAYHNQIRVLPEATGGRVVTNTNAPETFVPAVFAESGSYYVLGFDLPPSLRASAKVEVKVNRGGVKVHVQRAYAPPLPQPTLAGNTEAASAPMVIWKGASGPIALTPAGLATRAIEGMLPAKGLSMGATVVAVAMRDSNEAAVLVVSGVETSSAGPPSASGASRLELHVIALDPLARFKAETRHAVEIASNAVRHYDIVSRFTLKPGSYEIRTGAAGGDGRAGSVITYVDVPDFRKEVLSLSGVALTTVPPGAGTAADSAADVLPFVPTARRSFAATETIRSYVKVYQGGGDAIVPVQLDVRILDTRGRAMLDAGATLDAGRWHADRSTEFGLDMPLSALAPGEYLLTITATDGKHAVRRDVRFTISTL